MVQHQQPWYTVNGVEELDSPALLLYPDRVKKNIATLIEMAGGVERLRPHVKTSKSADACQLMLDAGISKFKCATIAEAEMLATIGAPDVLLAYQPVGPKIDRLIQLTLTYTNTRFSCLIDNEAALAAIALATAAAKALAVGDGSTNSLEQPLNIYIDLNVGMNRTGIPPGDEAFNLYMAAREMKGIKPVGLHAYDGHIHDASLSTRKERSAAAFEPVYKLLERIGEQVEDYPELITGGTPSFPYHLEEGRAICSPGTFVYWDKAYLEKFTEQPFLLAAIILTRVVSKPGPNLLCLDLGHKSIAAENELARRVGFLNDTNLQPVSQSEEHMVVTSADADRYKVGDAMYALAYHICPSVALYREATLIIDHKVAGVWKTTARDRRITL
ncbi:D-TA family PLP-dependent enzyme [Flavihumibacter sp.]|uniref:D-TA family PLP-dependent enzyme n=1 Tax=Flavihumibacter sp. TaxID=1913981 RepID=UPI002FCCA5D2